MLYMVCFTVSSEVSQENDRQKIVKLSTKVFWIFFSDSFGIFLYVRAVCSTYFEVLWFGRNLVSLNSVGKNGLFELFLVKIRLLYLELYSL